MFKQIEEDLLSLDSADVQYDENGVARYYVERICEMRYAYPSGKEYRVKWKGCSMDLSTWEPEQNLEKDPVVHKMMKEFEGQLYNSETAKKMSVIIGRHGTGQNRLMQTKFMIEGIEAQFAGDGMQTWRVIDNQALQHSGRRPEHRREPKEGIYVGEDSFSEGIKNQRRPTQLQSEVRATSKDEFGQTIRQPRVRSRQNRQSLTFTKERSRDIDRFQRNQGELPHDRSRAPAEELRIKNEDSDTRRRQTQEYEATSSNNLRERYTSGSPDQRRRYSSKENTQRRGMWNEESSRRSGRLPPPPESSSLKKPMPARKSTNYRRDPDEDIDVTPVEEQRGRDSEEPSQRIEYNKARHADRRKSSQGVAPRRYQDDSPEPELEPSEEYQVPQRSKSNKKAGPQKGFRVPLRERVSSSTEKKVLAETEEKSSSIKRRPAVKSAAQDNSKEDESLKSKSKQPIVKGESLDRESEGYKQISKKTTLLAGRRRGIEGERAKLSELTSEDGDLKAAGRRAPLLKPSELEELKRESLQSGSEDRSPVVVSKKTPSARLGLSRIEDEFIEDTGSKKKRGAVVKNEEGSLEAIKRKTKLEKAEEEYLESGLSSEEIRRRKEYKKRKEQRKDEGEEAVRGRSASNLLKRRKYIEDEEEGKKAKSRSRSRRGSKSRDALLKDYDRKLKSLRRRKSSRSKSRKSRSRSRRHSRSSRRSRSRSARREERLARRGSSRHRSRSSRKSRSKSSRRKESLGKLARRRSSRSASSKRKRGNSSRSKSRHSKRSRSRKSADLRKNRSSSGHRNRSGSRRSRKSHSSHRQRSSSRRSQSRGRDRPTSRREVEYYLERTEVAKIVRSVTVGNQSYFEVKWHRDRHGMRPDNSLIKDEYLAKINPKMVIEWMDDPNNNQQGGPAN